MDQTNQIKIVKAKIALLDAERRRLIQNLQNLEENSISEGVSVSQGLYSRNSEGHHTGERIKLFRSLFRGRDDVYARLWVSRKTGKSGYTPVCRNEWKPKICQKPVAKCYECPNRELSPLDDDVVTKHLKGESVVGIYPMMQDETCHFLAIDFYKERWRDNVLAFKETCLQQDVPVAIERSRSGNGAHAWIFFEQDVPAMIARKMGSFLITETMSKRYQLNMKSYDRLFPNQDTLPKGGFGNLIALPFQKEMMMKGNNEIGVLVTSPGIGKTVIAIYAIAKRKTNVLILVHRKPLMEQWRTQLVSFLNIDQKDIGQIGCGKNNSNSLIDIAMIQSMERKGIVDNRIADYGFIIIDECHHISAVSFERVLMHAKAKYVLGLTATPYRRDGHQPIIHMQCGPICHRIKAESVDQQIDHFILIPRLTRFVCEWSENSKIHDIWPKLIGDEQRNQLIVDDIVKVVDLGRFPIILTERRGHLEILANKLRNKLDHLVVLYRGLKPKKRKEMIKKLSACSAEQKKAILATGTYIGEGFDDPRLDTLFITMPISFKGRIVQYSGRLHRKYHGKKDVQIYDYIDAEIPVLQRMYQRRLKTYKMMGYDEIFFLLKEEKETAI